MSVREILDGLPIVCDDPAVNFVNTHLHSLGKDYLRTPAAAIDWFASLGMITEEEARTFRALPPDHVDMRRTISGLHELRTAVLALIEAVADGSPPDAADLERFRRLHLDATSHVEFTWLAEGHFRLDLSADDPRVMLWRMTRFAAELVTAPRHGRLRRCERPGCDWVFLDTSKAGRRRWCTPHICGNRMRLRSFLARHREGGEASLITNA